eukprot:gene10114-10271_t
MSVGLGMAAVTEYAFTASSVLCLPQVWQCLVERWFLIGVAVAVGFAAAVPQLGATKGYIRSEYSIKLPTIITIFIISGMGLKTKVLLSAASNLRIHLLVQGISLGLIPAVGYGIFLGLRHTSFNPYLAEGIVILASTPTTVFFNVLFTARAAGNEAAALVNAVLGSLIGTFITPLWCRLFLDVSGSTPYAAVLTELAYLVLAPLAVGQLLQYFLPSVGLRKVLGFTRPDVVAIVICASTKTLSMGVPLITVMYQRVSYVGLLAMPLIFYDATQALLVGMMLGRIKQWCLNSDDGSFSGTLPS